MSRLTKLSSPAIVALILVQLGYADDGKVKKSDLSYAAANAQAKLLEENGYGIESIKIAVQGGQPSYTIEFSKSAFGGNCYLMATPMQLDRAVADARRHGGVRFSQLKGFIVQGKVFFAFKTDIVGPRGSGVSFGIFRDIPAANFRALVQGERQEGGKLVDTSTYRAPNGREYHTAVFHRR